MTTDTKINLKKILWEGENKTFVYGKAFYKSDLYDADSIANLLNGINSLSDLKTVLKELNGFYGIIKRLDDKILIATDHIGSIPIFYSIQDKKNQKYEQIFVSDSFNQIIKQTQTKRWDPKSITEFLLSGYSSGSNTISKDINRLQAGEILSINLNKNEIERDRHFEYLQKPKPINSKKKLINELDKILKNSFKRFCKVADGRKVFLGLSGGYDSRLIALMLKRIGYENVFTYCHNLQNKNDKKISRMVSQDLGYHWEDFTHTHQEVFDTYNSEDWRFLVEDIGLGGGNITSPSSILQYKKIKNNGFYPSDGVKIVGHNAGAPGNFIPDRWPNPIKNQNKKISKNLFVKGILRSHYTALKFYWERDKPASHLSPRICNSINCNNRNKIDYTTKSEKWYWQERTPKRLLNHFYLDKKYWNDRWYPLWDRELAEFFNKIPIYLRYDKKLIKEYTDKLYKETCGLIRPTNKDLYSKSYFNSLLKKIRNFSRNLSLDSLAYKYYDRFRKHKNKIKSKEIYKGGVKYGIRSKNQFKRNYEGSERYNFYIISDVLDNYLSTDRNEELNLSIPYIKPISKLGL